MYSNDIPGLLTTMRNLIVSKALHIVENTNNLNKTCCLFLFFAEGSINFYQASFEREEIGTSDLVRNESEHNMEIDGYFRDCTNRQQKFEPKRIYK